MPEPARAPRTQQQRRDETRRAVLDATVESLIDVGFNRTTTLEVQRRADVSRGALLHHFPSKAELLVAAVDHLAEMRARELKRLAGQLPDEGAQRPREAAGGRSGAKPAAGSTAQRPREAAGGRSGAKPAAGSTAQRPREAAGGRSGAKPAAGSTARTDAVLELLWQCFSGTFFQVAMELRTAARTDPELRLVLIGAERALRERILLQARTLFGKDVADHPGLERALDLTLQFMIGAAMTAVLHKEDARLRGLIDDFKALFPTVLTNATTNDAPRSRGRSRKRRGEQESVTK